MVERPQATYTTPSSSSSCVRSIECMYMGGGERLY